MDKVYIWCDGGCRGNGKAENIGGYGIVMKCNDAIKEFYGSVENTTNQKMELKACIEALKKVKKDVPIHITTDSNYVVKGMNEWLAGWLKRNWKNVQNVELWKELVDLRNNFSDVTFEHCYGHSDNEGNNRADELANIAMDEHKANNNTMISEIQEPKPIVNEITNNSIKICFADLYYNELKPDDVLIALLTDDSYTRGHEYIVKKNKIDVLIIEDNLGYEEALDEVMTQYFVLKR